MPRLRLIAFALLFVPSRATAQQPYRDPTRPIGERVHDLLGRMSREEKFWQLFMIPGDLSDPAHDYSHGIFGLQIATPTSGRDAARAHAERINAIQRHFADSTRLGIPIIPFEEAVHGLARDGATMFPQAVALAATWDTTLVGRVATAIARETGSRGIRQALSPVLNLARDVRWGRVEETYGEDPLLASRMGLAFIGTFERFGIVTTPKHFIANVGAGGRDSYPIDLSRRELEEVYFPPFAATVRQANARSVMTAYNSVDGLPATQNRWLLNQTLKGAWGFRGFVISDAAATGAATVLHMTEPTTPVAAQHALQAGLDVIFQSSYEQHRPYWEAVRRGLVSDSILDAAVTRVLRAKFELGLFEHPYVNPDSAAYWNGHADHRTLARDAARASIVLLKNERAALPLASRVRTIALIGADAIEARLGGYSAPGIHTTSILDALRTRLGDTRVRFAPGPGRASRDYVVVSSQSLSAMHSGTRTVGLHAEYFDNPRLAGSARVARTDSVVDVRWTFNAPARGLSTDWYSVRWTGTITVPRGGVHRLGVEGNDGYRLYIDGKILIDDWRKQSYRTTLANVALAPGSQHDVKLEYFETIGNARVRLVWDAGVKQTWRASIDSAVAAANRSELAIVVAGIEEGEFRDRASLSLPGHQEELIQRVAATGKPVVVVLIGGSAITMSTWLDRVDAVLDAWYPGEAGGEAIADVLFGDYSPAGRLPITFPIAEGQLPLTYDHKPTGRGDDYVDLSGAPLFPFGFGLGYTTFDYSSLDIRPAALGTSESAIVRCVITNTGQRAGDEVVQLYIRDMLASVARPVMQLAGFERMHLRPGESQTVTFTLGPEQLRMLDRDMHWVVEPGTFRVMIGSSSKDIRLRGDLTVL